MSRGELAELDDCLNGALRSSTIEWAINLRICDLLQANPPLAPMVMARLESCLRKENAVPVLLGLSLLEMLVKNCGFPIVRCIDAGFAETLANLVKKREGFWYGVGRNLSKSRVSGWLPQGVGVGEDERKLWLQASHKVLEMLQLWADAFLLQEGQLQPIFKVYKQLRQEGYKFPRNQQGASTGLCLVQGAEESPAFMAGAGSGGGTSSQEAAPAAGYQAPAVYQAPSIPAAPTSPASSGAREAPPPAEEQAAAPPSPSRAPAQQPQSPTAAQQPEQVAPCGVREVDDARKALAVYAETGLVDHLKDVRARVLQYITDPPEERPEVAELHMQLRLDVLQELNDAIDNPVVVQRQSSGVSGPSDLLGDEEDEEDGLPAVPPPPSEAPPDREQQEQYDLILARYLQERENALFAAENEEADAELARRIAMEEEGGIGFAPRPQPQAVRCMRCGSVNHLREYRPGIRFSCFQCGLYQGTPEMMVTRSAPARRFHPAPRPTRQAPTAHVIPAAGEAPELLIGGAKGSQEVDGELKESRGRARTASASSAIPKGGLAATADSDETFSTGLLGGSDGSGGGLSGKAKPWAKWAPAGGGSGSSSRRLGDGVPSREYANLGGDDSGTSLFDSGASLFGAPPAKDTKKTSLGSGLFSRRKRKSEHEESLLDRVQVDQEWELIRPAAGRPYWYNSVTQVSQWNPPDVVRGGG